MFERRDLKQFTMWLLSTSHAELRWFTDASAVPGPGYAILSHTWGAHEQTFQDVRSFGEQCKASGKNPRDFVSSKIRNCCLLAEKYGYQWVWVDSCCIDKTSSTELSEAINSMFKWYWQAEVCFAFLADVPTEDDLRAETSAFRNSRWHKRGWTLQELIAPAVVIFLSVEWTRLGTKAELSELLYEITHIPQRILTRQEYYHYPSVANRMRWAANRMTTRMEDQAYCLMGLFNVNMTVIYGEGPLAFQRLQQEIMRNGYSDTSLFAWGPRLSSRPFHELGLELVLDPPDRQDNSSYLLAPSPSSFLTGIHFTPGLPNPKHFYPPLVCVSSSTSENQVDEDSQNVTDQEKAHGAPFDGIEVPTARLDSYGVVCRLPVFEEDGVMVAILLCEDESHEHVGLLLNLMYPVSYDPIRPMYHTSAAFIDAENAEQQVLLNYRLVTLGDDLYNLQFNGKAVQARWRTLYINPRPQAWNSPDTSISQLRLNCTVHPAFRLPHWLMARFATLGFQLLPEAGSDGGLPIRLLLRAVPHGEFIFVDLGLCGGGDSQPGIHWAKVLIHHDKDTSNWDTPVDTHDCTQDHIASWPEGKRLFGDASGSTAARSVRLSFSSCTLAVSKNSRTLAVHIELEGSIYANIIKDRAGEVAKSENSEPSEAPKYPWSTYILLFVGSAVFWPLLSWLWGRSIRRVIENLPVFPAT